MALNVVDVDSLSKLKRVSVVAQWQSAGLEIEGLRARASPEALCCVFEQDTLSSAYYWFNP